MHVQKGTVAIEKFMVEDLIKKKILSNNDAIIRRYGQLSDHYGVSVTIKL